MKETDEDRFVEDFLNHFVIYVGLIFTVLGAIFSYIFAKEYSWITGSFIIAFLLGTFHYCHSVYKEKAKLRELLSHEKTKLTKIEMLASYSSSEMLSKILHATQEATVFHRLSHIPPSS